MSTRVEIIESAAGNAPVTKLHHYDAQVTLSVEAKDGSLMPSGWSTRTKDGKDGSPFSFQPGNGLIEGWTEGVLKMREGERALMHVPSSLGYGSKEMGSKGGAWYIPANSDLLFDIKIVGKAGKPAAKAEL